MFFFAGFLLQPLVQPQEIVCIISCGQAWRVDCTGNFFFLLFLIFSHFYVGSMCLVRLLHLARSCVSSLDNSFSDKSFPMVSIHLRFGLPLRSPRSGAAHGLGTRGSCFVSFRQRVQRHDGRHGSTVMHLEISEHLL